MGPMRRRAALLCCVAGTALAACGTPGDDRAAPGVTPPAQTVPGVGLLPAPLPAAGAPADDTSATAATDPSDDAGDDGGDVTVGTDDDGAPSGSAAPVGSADVDGSTSGGTSSGGTSSTGTAAGRDVPPAPPGAASSAQVAAALPVDDDGAPAEALGERASGGRLLVIGDSVLASVADGAGGELCPALVPLGWQVEVDAEAGRPVEFGERVLEERLPDDVAADDDWDAAVVQLGGDDGGGDPERYFDGLNEVLYWLAPRPTLVLTVGGPGPGRAGVNDAIERLDGLYGNVTVLDWASLAEVDGVVGRDGSSPTPAGRATLVEALSTALGSVDGGSGGACLPGGSFDDATAGAGGDGSAPVGTGGDGEGSSGVPGG